MNGQSRQKDFPLQLSKAVVLGRLSLHQDLDGTVARERSLTAQNLRYIREATLGYHFDVGSGLDVEGGIFMSYLSQYPPPDLATRPGTDLRVYGFTGTFEVMPTDFLGLRLEGVWRRSSVPYFAGRGGTTSEDGFQGTPSGDFTVDSRREQTLLLVAANFRL
ncbi:hypothetical protein ACLESO_09210 [Pyxidicoccus sp. 3LG]